MTRAVDVPVEVMVRYYDDEGWIVSVSTGTVCGRVGLLPRLARLASVDALRAGAARVLAECGFAPNTRWTLDIEG